MNTILQNSLVILALFLFTDCTYAEEDSWPKARMEPVVSTSQNTTATTSAPISNVTTQEAGAISKVSSDSRKPLKTSWIKGPLVSFDCPAECSCVGTTISCDDRKLKAIPNLSRFTNLTEISLKYNLIEKVDFNLLPIGTLESLDLSFNTIKTFVNATKKVFELSKLRTLNLKSNQIENLTGFSTWRFSALENLDLSINPVEEIGPVSFNKTLNLQNLHLEQTKLKFINELAFSPLTQLKLLNISNVKLSSYLGDRQFERNQKLETIDMSENDLIEVPHALRSTSSIENLYLNKNLMTSLRQSDFVNRSALQYLEIKNCSNLTKIDEFTFSKMDKLLTLKISDNPRLRYISKDAFTSDKKRELIIDISGNNLTTLADIREFVTIDQIIINNNPWNCNCDLKWMENLSVAQRSLAHCKSPNQFKDMEVRQYFLSTFSDCNYSDQSDYRLVFLTIILLFLLGLSVVTFVQKNEQCRRLFWKDQYGTIYYTKASFPPENA